MVRASHLIAAVFLPPLGVFLGRGLGPVFWMSVALTALFWVPGVIFAVIAVAMPQLALWPKSPPATVGARQR